MRNFEDLTLREQAEELAKLRATFDDMTLREQAEVLAKLRAIVLALEVERLLEERREQERRRIVRYMPDRNGDWDPTLLS